MSLAALLAAGIAGGGVNLAVSLLDRPKVYADAVELATPLAIGCAIFLVGALVLRGLARALRVLAPAASDWAIVTLATLVGGMTPLVQGLVRDVDAQRAPVLWACFAGVLVAAGSAAYLLAERLGARPGAQSFGRVSLVSLSAAALATLGGLWALEYPLAGASTQERGIAVLACTASALFVGGVAWRSRASLRPARWIAALALAGICAPLLGAFGGGAAGGTRKATLVAGAPRTIVLLTIDTLRPDFIAHGGPQAAETPAIDALLADSVVFERARSAAPWTKPALATIHTGLSPLVHGTTNRRVRLPDGVKTIAEYLSEAGYATLGVGLNVHLEHLYNFGQGFDEYAFPARGDYGIAFGARVMECFDPHRFPELFPSTQAIADVALEKIRAHAQEPFFLWLHVLDPHWPYEPPPELVTAQRSTSGMGFRFGDHETVTNVQAGNLKLGLDDQRWVKELYKGEIRLMDQNVGRILDELRELGLYDESLIVFASDHGEEFFEHGNFEHGHTLFDEVLRVPIAFKLPRASRKLRVAVDVSSESLAPTLLDLAGLEIAAEAFDGSSLVPLVEGTGMAVPPSISTGTYYHGEKAAVVVDGYKYVVEYDTGRELLFHLAEDPQELRSLAAARPELVLEARTLLGERVKQSLERRTSMGLVVEEVELDDATREQLRRLGYIGEGGKKEKPAKGESIDKRLKNLDYAGEGDPKSE